MSQFGTPPQVLSLTNPALVSASPTSSSGGFGWGMLDYALFMVQATRAGGSMTAVKFSVWGSRTGQAGTWVQLPVYKASDTGKTLGADASVAVSSNSTAYDGIICDAAKQWPFLDVRGQAVTADAAANESCAAYRVPL